MKFTSTLLLTFFIGILSVQAQDFKDKLFPGWGFQFGIGQMPAFLTEGATYPVDQFGDYFYGLHYRLRYNLTEIGDNQSVGIGIVPAIEFASINTNNFTGYVNLNIPIEASLNLGAGSTYNSASNFGFGLKGGIDINVLPLFQTGTDPEDGAEIKKFYAAPYIAMAFRYWKRSNDSLKEFFIRYDFMKNESGTDIQGQDTKKPFFVRIGFTRFIGY